jgi:molybdate transport system regulatory protein
MPTRARRKKNQRLELKGLLWMAVGDQNLGGPGRMGLLRAVAQHGSITQAAKAFGMSYKGAWDAIEAMNTLSGTPLVERSTGGRGGGFTRLTEHGRRLVERFEAVEAVHQRFLQLLDGGSMDLDEDFSLLRVVNMKTSARNQWVGTVSGVRAGAVNDEVELTLAGGTRLAAIVTRESTQALGLRLQQTVVAMVKASAVLVAVGMQDAKVSARNQLHGTVRTVTPGAVNAEVAIETADGVAIVAVITQAALRDLGLSPGAPATALIKASDVILAVLA